MTNVPDETPEQEIVRLRCLVSEAPHDVEAVIDLAHALLVYVDSDAELSVVDEPIALLRTALDLVGVEPLDRAAINADLADLHAWRCFTAAERGVDTAVADRDSAIEYWAGAEEAATEAGWLAELITRSAFTVLEQVDLLVARATDDGVDDDLEKAVELAGALVEELPDDDQDRDAAQYGYALVRALRYDRRSARVADLHGAIQDFRELWQRIDEEHPLYADTAAWLGLVLAARVRHDDPEIASHVAEAVAQLEIADTAAYPVARLHFGALLAVRYLYLAGGEEARDAAVAVFRGLLELPELDELMADVCHAGLALLTLAAATPGARRWRLAPGERALDRLRGEAGETAGDEAGRHLESLTKQARACLLPAVAVPSEDPDEIVDSVRLLGMGHPLRGVLLNVFGTTAMSQEVHTELLALVERALRHIPDDSPWREPALSVLATTGAPAIIEGDGAAVEVLRVLLTDVVSRPAADQDNRAVNEFLLAFVTTACGLASQDADLLTEAIQRMRDAAASAPAGHWTVEHAEGLLSSLLNLRWIAGNEREYLDAAVYYSGGKAAAGGQEAAAERVDALTSSLLAQLSAGSSRASSELLAQTIAELDEEGARLPDEHVKRSSAAIVANVARMQIAGRRHGFHSAAVRDSAVSFGRIAEAVIMPNDTDPYTVTALASARMNSAYARRNLDEVDRALADMAAASAASSLEGRERAILLTQLGMGFCLRYELSEQVRDLHLGIDRMSEADRLFRQQPGGVFPPLNAMSLAKAYHTRGDKALGDRQRAVATGLEALRDRAADVRVQSGTRRAMDEAATVARDAVEVVRWCLAAEQPHAAVTALELGRAMVVHVATSDPSVPEALRARGANDLAAEWESTQDTQLPWDLPHTDLVRGASPELFAGLAAKPVPNDLRRRALRVIGENEDPPTVPEIAGTLQDRDITALVYLLPRDRYGRGIALLVGQDEQPTTVALSGLDTAAGGRIAEMRRVHEELARVEAGTPEWVRLREHGNHVVGEMCDWAWSVAMADVLDALPAAHPARLVIVPVGALAAVPWHAARRPVGDGRLRYACQDAVISYAASARQFVDATRRPTRPWQSAPGLVRVAESTLYWASREIEGIRDRYYPDATYLGGRGRRSRPGHRPATTDNVRALLPGLDSPGASVIHLGCHAHLADPPLDSYLSLGDGRLQVGDILNQARQRPLDAPGGLVVLAACTSDASEAIHDESLSLATAFLAAGAAGVVGARWAVDDVPTAAFMIMFHHYLNSGYAEPATALRATQLWMLNPRRRLPAGFDPVLADELTRLDLTEVVNWAAFTYQGR